MCRKVLEKFSNKFSIFVFLLVCGILKSHTLKICPLLMQCMEKPVKFRLLKTVLFHYSTIKNVNKKCVKPIVKLSKRFYFNTTCELFM